MMRPYAEEKQLKFRIKYKFPLPKLIVTDAKRLKQILLNLCSNAIKFTSDGNVDISIVYENDLKRLQFDVTDTGVGMTQEELERLFSPFSQADTSTTRQFGGSGLGLCICKELVNSLGGEIKCQSRKGIGSRFFFTVDPGPIESDQWVHSYQADQVEIPKIKVKIEPDSLTGKVLLAEDTVDNQKLISMYIKRSGATPVVVENGKQALDKALADHFDLILMDMQMPVMGGIDAIVKLRATGYTRPIVALTANALKEDRDKCQQAGVDEYLTKPVDLNQFNTVLKRYLHPKNHSSLTTKAASFKHTITDIENDPEYQAMLRQFEAELPEKLKLIQSAADSQDWVELKNLVHKLKGLGASFGYPELSDISAKIQTNIVKQQFNSISNLVEQLADSCQQCDEQSRLPSNF